MKRTKLLFCVLAILAALIFAGCGLADGTPELDFEIPESVVFGMPIPISGITTSETVGSIDVIIGENTVYRIYPEEGEWPESVSVSNDSLFRYYTKTAGRYDISLKWYKGDGTDVSVKKYILLEEAEPATSAPTICSADSTGVSTSEFYFGDTVTLHGKSGGATKLYLYGDVSYGNRINEVVLPDADGNWTYTMEAPHQSADIRFEVRGFIGDEWEGRFTGFSEDCVCYFFDPENEPDTAHVTVTEINYTTADLEIINPDPDKYDIFSWAVLNPDGVVLKTGGQQMYNYDTVYSTYVHLDYRGEYILETLLHNYSGDYTKPVRTPVTVKDGRPYPVNGYQTVNVTLPETWEARKDMTITWDPSLPDQQVSFSLSWQPPGYTYYTGSNASVRGEGAERTIPGYGLQPGEYRLDVTATTDTYRDTERRFIFTVTENSETPAAPVLSEVKGQTWPQFDMQFVLTETWTAAYAELRYPTGGINTRQEITNSDRFTMSVYDEGTYDLYACGKQNGIWSEMVKIGEVEVTAPPAVSQVTAYPPETLRYGVECRIPVLLPGDSDRIEWKILSANGDTVYSTYDWDYDTFTTLYIDDMVLNKYADAPGNYELELEYGGQKVRYPLTVAGEKPVALTVQAEAQIVPVGDTVRITGTAGSADRIVLEARAHSESSYYSLNKTVNPVIAADGTWEYTVTASKPGSYYFNITGYAEDGRITGRESTDVLVPDENSSLDLHMELDTDPDDGHYLRMTLSADGMNGYTEWKYFITGPDGKIFAYGSDYGYESENGVASTSHYTRYRGTYTVSAYVKEEGTQAVYGGPVTQSVTVTEGRPWPVNGPTPTGLDIPETWPAGVELNLEWAPVVGTQSIDIQMYRDNNNLYGYQAGSPSVFSLGSLEEGVYRFRITTEADTYEYTEAEYKLRVVENPNRPADPVLTLPEQTIYPGAAFTVQLDKAYDEVDGYVTGNNSGRNGCNFRLKGEQVLVQDYWLSDYDEFTLFLRVKQDGVWSRYSSLQVASEDLPDTDEITFVGIPESVRFGEAFDVGIIFPDDGEGFSGIFYYTITDAASGSERISSSRSMRNVNYYSFIFGEGDLINWLNGPGTCDVKIEYGSHTATFQLQVTGEKPVIPTANANPMFAETGDTIRVSGKAGSADVLDVYYERNGKKVNLGHPDLTTGGVWSVDIPADASGSCYVYAKGYTSEGLYTGTAVATIVVSDENCTAVPQVELTVDPYNGQRVELVLTAPGEWDESQWWYGLTGPDGKSVWMQSAMEFNGDSYETSFYTNYQGTYTLTACCRVQYPNGERVLSRPESVTFTITEGRPWPVNGPAPTGLDEIPASVRAGEELTLNWTPVDHTHEISVSIYKGNNYISGSGRSSTGGTMNLLLEDEGNYRITIWSYLDTYENTYIEYPLTVTANPDQPAPPELTLVDENVYCQVPFTVQLDDVYEDAKCYITVETPGSRSYGQVDHTLKGNLLQTRTGGGTHILEAGKFTLSVSVKKNGVWSKKSSIEITLTDLPEVTEITAIGIPETLQRGEDMDVTILLPGQAYSGNVEVGIKDIGKNRWMWSNTWCEGNVFNWSFEGYALTNNGCPEGRYYVYINWNGQTKEWPFTMVGEEPELLTLDTIPADLQAGGSVTLSGTTGDADRIRVTYDTRDRWYQNYATVHEDGTWSCELTNLPAGKCYLNIYGYNGSLSTGVYRSNFFVSDGTSMAKPVLTASTTGNNINVTMTPGDDMTGKTVRWHVEYHDLHGRNYSSDYNQTSGNDSYRLNIYDQYANTYTITAVYEADDVYSMPEQIVVQKSGKVWPVNGKAPLNLEIPETLEGGRDLQVAWTPEVPGQWMDFSVRDPETDNSVYSVYTQKAETFLLNGYLLDSGVYTVYVSTGADTYENVSRRYTLTVTESADRPAGPNVSVEPETPTESSVVHLKLDRSYGKVGAVIVSEEGYRRNLSTTTDTDDIRCGSYSVGEWEAKVYVFENGVWSQPGTVALDIQEDPMLDEPEFDPSTPDTVEIGNPLPVKVTGIDPNAKRVFIEIVRFYESDSWDYLYNCSNVLRSGETYTTEIPEEVFEEAGTYSLMVGISGKGYHSAYIDKSITVTGERPEAPTVYVSTESAAFGETFYATVLANGAAYAEAAYNETYGNFDPSIGVYPMKNGRVRIPMTVMGENDYHFRVQVNGKWSKWSESVWVETEWPEQMDSDLFHVTFPDSLTAGEDATVVIEPIEGLSHYNIDVNGWIDGDGETGESYFYHLDDVGTGAVTIPGAYFKQDYRVNIYVYGCDEMYNSRVEKEKMLTVSGGSAGARLTISSDEARYAYGAPATISLGGVQAEKVLIRGRSESVYEEDYDSWSIWYEMNAAPGETLASVTMSFWETGDNYLQAAALVNGTWTDWSDTLVIRVDEPAGALPAVRSNVEVIDGMPHVTWSPVEHAEEYYIHWSSTDGTNRTAWVEQGTTSYDITDELRPGVGYTIYVTAWANGYTNKGKTLYWVVYPEDESPIVNILTLPAALTVIEEEAFAGTGAEKVVIPSACETVAANAFAGSSSLRVAEVQGVNTVVDPAAFSGCGTVIVYVLPDSAAEASLAGATNVELRYPEN